VVPRLVKKVQSMRLYDPLYGVVELPNWLHPVILSPEVQRLRDVRLINTKTLSCPALSDTRRFSHVVGVCSLATRLGSRIRKAWSQAEERAFIVASLVHDVATPAFGHLFEYLYNAIGNWNHEEFVENVIKGNYRKEKRYHQMYFGYALRLYDILSDLDIDKDLVLDLITGRNALGQLLAGSIDIDNIDNVYRMATMLGIRCNTDDAIQLVDSMIPTRDGLVLREAAKPLIHTWQELRRRIYNFLAFDVAALGGQVMLTDCITLALRDGSLDEGHWFYTDEQLTRFLAEKPETKDIINRFAVGDLYQPIYIGWYSVPKGELDLREPRNRDNLIRNLELRLAPQAAASLLEENKKEKRKQMRMGRLKKTPCSTYVFYDNGTFSKDLAVQFESPSGDLEHACMSSRSQSTVVAVFTPHRLTPSAVNRLRPAVKRVLEDYGFHDKSLMPMPDDVRDEDYLPNGKTRLI
jgi:HD superfamily phosphohydrolase